MSGPKMSPLVALAKAIRSIAAHNTAQAIAYVTDPAPFAALTQAQRDQVYRSACSLFGLKSTAERPVTHEALVARAAEYERLGRSPRFVWVSTRFAPLAQPGVKRRPSLQVQFTEAVKAGMIAPAADFVATITANLYTPATPKGTIEQQPRKGGFIVALHEDADAQRKERKAQGPVSGGKYDAAELGDLF